MDSENISNTPSTEEYISCQCEEMTSSSHKNDEKDNDFCHDNNINVKVEHHEKLECNCQCKSPNKCMHKKYSNEKLTDFKPTKINIINCKKKSDKNSENTTECNTVRYKEMQDFGTTTSLNEEKTCKNAGRDQRIQII